MCGFVGFFGKLNPIKKKQLSKATKLLEHRGNIKPQFYYDNLFSCGFSRLAMLDLNSRANQPYIKENYNFVLCFNGELYNYKELRKTLENENYVFETNSDTEVFYYAFDFFGEKCFEKFIEVCLQL